MEDEGRAAITAGARGRVETVGSQLEVWGVQRLHARTHEGWLCKVLASLFAVTCLNAL